MLNQIIKRCSKCQRIKDVSDFPCIRSKIRPQRFSSYCKSCTSDSVKKWIVKHQEEYKDIQKRGTLNHRTRNPQKYAARTLSFNHRNEILKDTCEMCGTKKQLQMHHVDYTKPLQVTTLCRDCHFTTHGGWKHA